MPKYQGKKGRKRAAVGREELVGEFNGTGLGGSSAGKSQQQNGEEEPEDGDRKAGSQCAGGHRR